MIGKTIQQISLGDRASFTKTVSETDVYLYAGITGDLNPAHIDQLHAAGTVFQTRIAHGMLTAGFISAVLGMQLPGPGTIYLGQTLRFLAPVRIGETVTALVEVIEIDQSKNRLRLRTTCTNQNRVVVVEGEATVSPPKAPKSSDLKGTISETSPS